MSDWPLKYHDAAASNATDSPLAPPLRLRWKQKVRKAQYAVCNGKMLFVQGFENLYGFDLQSGKLIREYKGTSVDRYPPVASQVACSQGLLLYTSCERVGALQPESGRPAWKADLPMTPFGAIRPLVCDDSFVFCPGTTLKAESGNVANEYRKACPGRGSFVAANREFVAVHNEEHDRIIVFRRERPRNRCSIPLKSECMRMEMNARFLYATLRDPGKEASYPTYAWDLQKGVLKWRVPFGLWGRCVTDDRLFMVAGVERQQQAFVALSAEMGKEIWRNSERLVFSNSTPIASKELVWLTGCFSNDKGEEVRRLIAVSHETGETRWRMNLTQYPEHLLITGNLLVATFERTVHCYEPDDGSAKAPASKPTTCVARPASLKEKPCGRRKAVKPKDGQAGLGSYGTLLFLPKSSPTKIVLEKKGQKQTLCELTGEQDQISENLDVHSQAGVLVFETLVWKDDEPSGDLMLFDGKKLRKLSSGKSLHCVTDLVIDAEGKRVAVGFATADDEPEGFVSIFAVATGKQLRRYKLDEGLSAESMRWEDDETISFEDESGGRWQLNLNSGETVAPEEDEGSVD